MKDETIVIKESEIQEICNLVRDTAKEMNEENQPKEGEEKGHCHDQESKCCISEKYNVGTCACGCKRCKACWRCGKCDGTEQKVAKKTREDIFTKLITIADAGEYEDLRREVENLKHQYNIE